MKNSFSENIEFLKVNINKDIYSPQSNKSYLQSFFFH